ncbi:MAG: hypothetical protein ACI9G1_005980, partial [Pirellulaceae bacterium]
CEIRVRFAQYEGPVAKFRIPFAKFRGPFAKFRVWGLILITQLR